MKKLLYVIIAIMLVTTSCQKDTNNTSTTGNGTNSVTKKNTIGTFATSSAAVNFAATPFPSYGQSGDYFNVTALRNSDCHYSNVSGNYLLCYFDHLDNGLTGNANKGGAEVTHQFTFTNFTGSQGHGIRDARLGKYLSAWLSADRECTASAPFRQAPSSESDPRAIVDRR